jgi:hypothetical protein
MKLKNMKTFEEKTSELNISDVRSSLWVNGDDRTPTENLWFICYADGVRQPLKYNKHNQFWVALAGKTYNPNEIERWLDA